MTNAMERIRAHVRAAVLHRNALGNSVDDPTAAKHHANLAMTETHAALWEIDRCEAETVVGEAEIALLRSDMETDIALYQAIIKKLDHQTP